MASRKGAGALPVAVVSAALLLTGCGAAPGPIVPSGSVGTSSTSSTPSPSSPSSSASSTSPGGSASPAEEGVSLQRLGFTHGPAELRLPTDLRLTTSADQVQQVTLVISSPAPAEVSDFLRRSLPTTGFTIARQQSDAIEFSGHGWSGSFVATGALSAVTLQPTS